MWRWRISASQFALAGSLLASEHFHLVLSGYAKLSHIFSNLVFMTSSLNFLLHRELDKVYNRREEYSYSYILSRSLLFSALFIEIIYHFPQITSGRYESVENGVNH